MAQLPDTLAGLLRVALDDLRIVESNPDYVVDMECWHTPASDGCHVCLAGAILVGQVGLKKTDKFRTFEFNNSHLAMKLACLNMLRCGVVNVTYGLFYGLNSKGRFEDFKIADYKNSRDRFYTDLELLVVYLQGQGI